MIFLRRRNLEEDGVTSEDKETLKRFRSGDVDALGTLLSRTREWDEGARCEFFNRAQEFFRSQIDLDVKLSAFDKLLSHDGPVPVHFIDFILETYSRGGFYASDELEVKAAKCLGKFIPVNPKLNLMSYPIERLDRAARESNDSAKVELRKALAGVHAFLTQRSGGSAMTL